ncbi:lysophospholipase [Mrakia frigida]|uniref:lysophospholipase n=1 Tax=Mrakia frigida TaxID=29902 RepID=UPI003FCC0A39
MTSSPVTTIQEWLVGPLNTPFFTTSWSVAQPERTIVFVHGFNEHITRYDHYFTLLSQLTSSRIFAFDQRGFGHSAFTLPPSSEEHSHLKGTKRSRKGITNTPQQRVDIEFWVRKEAEKAKGGKVWLYGHSMGGALVLGIPTYAASSASGTNAGDVPLLSLLSGIISSSPLIHQTTPAPKWQVSLGNGVANLTSFLANRHIPAPVDPAQLSRDPAKVEENRKDVLCPQTASLGALGPMLLTGQALLTDGAPKDWPVDLPLLIVHGTADAITSPKASHEFHSLLPAEHIKNKYITVEGGFHELHNEPAPIWEHLAKDVSEFVLAQSSNSSVPVAAQVETVGAGEQQSKL